jgi:ABC-type multidrug transport system fused ATPase/permease subunit
MKQAARFLWPYLRRYRADLTRGFAALTAKGILTALLPWLIGTSIDALTSGRGLRVILGFAGLIVTVSAF